MWEKIRRGIAGLCILAATRGIFKFLGTQGIYPENWIASTLGYVASPDILSSIVWIASGAMGLLALVFWPDIEDFIRKISRKSSLEIIFDLGNPAKKFWSLEAQRNKAGEILPPACWQYRVEIRNIPSKTLKSVRVSAEATGQVGSRPLNMPFDKDQSLAVDINPRCSELVTILRWPHPKIQAGMLAGSSALEYGPIIIVASADDALPKTRIFNFNYQQTPMIFD